MPGKGGSKTQKSFNELFQWYGAGWEVPAQSCQHCDELQSRQVSYTNTLSSCWWGACFPPTSGWVAPLSPTFAGSLPLSTRHNRPLMGSVRQAGQKLLAALQQELQGAPSPDVRSHHSLRHGPSVDVSPLPLNPLHTVVVYWREERWKNLRPHQTQDYSVGSPRGWQKRAPLERLAP